MAIARYALLALAALLASVPPAAAQFDPDADHPWTPDRNHVLTWRLVGCSGEVAEDVELGAAQLNKELVRTGIDLRFHPVGRLAGMSELAEFAEEGPGGLLVAAVVQKAQADVVVACVPEKTFRVVTGNDTTQLYALRLAYQVSNRSGDSVEEFRGAVALIWADQAIPTENCADPRPVGHALRQAATATALLGASGLGARESDPQDMFGPLEDNENRSCSAWFVPQERSIGGATAARLGALWGTDAGPGLSGTVAASMKQHTLWWVLVPLAVVGLAVGGVAWMERRQRRPDPRRRPKGVVRRGEDGMPRDVAASMFRPDGSMAAKERKDPYAPADFSDLAGPSKP